jgi:hypothetical protein
VKRPFNMPDEFVQGFVKAGQEFWEALAASHPVRDAPLRPSEERAKANPAPRAIPGGFDDDLLPAAIRPLDQHGGSCFRPAAGGADDRSGTGRSPVQRRGMAG